MRRASVGSAHAHQRDIEHRARWICIDDEIVSADRVEALQQFRAVAGRAGAGRDGAAAYRKHGPPKSPPTGSIDECVAQDAAHKAGVARCVVVDTHGIMDPSFTHTERSPIVRKSMPSLISS